MKRYRDHLDEAAEVLRLSRRNQERFSELLDHFASILDRWDEKA